MEWFSRLPRCCRRYKIRSFDSRGGALVLVWNFCVVTAAFTYGQQIADIFPIVLNKANANSGMMTPTIILWIAILMSLAIAPFIGWLADKYGNFLVFKVGSTGIFAVSVLYCSIIVYTSALGDSFVVNYPVLLAALFAFCFLGAYFAIAICSVLLQLGLDQLPYASSESIESFVNWSFFCFLTGVWCGQTIYISLKHCIEKINGIVILSLVPVAFMSIVLGSNFILSNQWLIKNTASAQSLKNIYHVLKFAATHKSPINRSALTYWENDIPSRIDLAKQRYGGPYTTEEVEDVKTFFKLLIVFLPLIFTVSSLATYGVGLLDEHNLISVNTSTCFNEMVYTVTYNPTWCAIFKILVYGFIIYPLIRNRLPSMLKRIGIASLFVFVCNIIQICWIVAGLYTNTQQSRDWYLSVRDIVILFGFQSIVSTIYEFVCAQSPYSKRGILIGFTSAIVVISMTVNQVIVLLNHQLFNNSVIPTAQVSIATAFSLIGFVLYCIASHKYKMRVREDIDNPHMWVENAYDKYFDQHDAYVRRLRST